MPPQNMSLGRKDCFELKVIGKKQIPEISGLPCVPKRRTYIYRDTPFSALLGRRKVNHQDNFRPLQHGGGPRGTLTTNLTNHPSPTISFP